MSRQYSVLKGYFVALGSLLVGASVVHRIYNPDLHIPIHEDTTAKRVEDKNLGGDRA